MAKINILDKSIAELIAAGEVIERPLSVVKELVENSIDAGADMITVEIQNGGVTFIRVMDNGCGIDKEDIPKAFLRHATSKVMSKEDLNNIFTLGFRGEALASICAVSKVDIITKTKDSLYGTKYSICGGEEIGVEDAGCPIGTTIIVKDLFYNVPARMKFLKKDVSEANAVASIIDKIAMSHPEIAFNFIRDGRSELRTAGKNDLLQTIYAVYGKNVANNLIPVDYNFKGIGVKGYISKPESAVANRVKELFFINGRFVKTQTGSVAVEEAFKRTIPLGRFPMCFLNISMDCSEIDVNVHPAKLEVRFTNEKLIFDAIYHATKSSLLKNNSPLEVELNKVTPIQLVRGFSDAEFKQMKMENAQTDCYEYIVYTPPKSTYGININNTEKDNSEKVDELIAKPIISKPILSSQEDIQPPQQILEENKEKEHQKEIISPIDIQIPINLNEEKNSTIEKTETKEILIKEEETLKDDVAIKYVGEAFDTYIIVEYGEDKLMLIDKHAAHERILYEKLRKEQNKCLAQYLLEPITLTLDKIEYDIVLSNKEELYRLGYEIDDFGVGTIIIRTAPEYLRNMDIIDTLMEVITFLMENRKDLNTEKVDWFFANIACRSAIKAGNKSTAKELIDIALKVQNDTTLRYCPHGRPVSFIITRKELEKQFFRM